MKSLLAFRVFPTLALSTIGAICLSPLTVSAQLIVSDTFSDGSAANSGDQTTDADTLDIPWFAIRTGNDLTTPTDATLDPAAPNLVLNRTPGGSARPIVGTLYSTTNAAASATYTSEAAASSVVLGTEEGSQISLTFDLRFTAVPSVSTLQLGLFNSNATPFIDDTPSTSNNDFGYYATVSVNNVSPSVPSLIKDLGTGGTSSDNGGMFLGDITNLGATGTALSIDDTNPHTLRLTLTRTTSGLNGNVEVALFFDNTQFASATDSSGTPFSAFDQIAFSSGNYTYRLDDVMLSQQIIPEPSAFAMLLGGLGMMMGFQRARRK